MAAPARRYGMTIPFDGVPLSEHRDWFRELVDLGYTDVWSAEANGADAFTPLALAAAWAPELRLGSAIVPAFTRGPACLAQSVASLADAALRRGMLRLAGGHSDGAIVNWLSAEDVRTVVPIVAEAAQGAARPDPEVVARIFVAPTTDRDIVLGGGRMAIAAYLNVPVYAAFHEWLGRGELLADMWRLWGEGDRRAALEAIPESLVDELIVSGTPEECREHIGRYVEAGVSTPALAILPFGLDQRQALRDLAPV